MNILDILKDLALRFLTGLVILLVLATGLGLIFINGTFISNIINSVFAGEYIGVDVGIQIVLVILSLVWTPLFLLQSLSAKRSRR